MSAAHPRGLRGKALAELPLDKCSTCTRGREACTYCEGLSDRDFEAICDCGLIDFGRHIVDCQSRSRYRYVIAQDPATAMLPRAKGKR